MNKNAPLTSPRINQGASRGIFGDFYSAKKFKIALRKFIIAD